MPYDMDWWVYIIENRGKTKLYTGIALDPDRRLIEHNTSPRGAKATKAGRPWKLVYRELQKSKGDALRRELAIKKLPRAQKLRLVYLKDMSEPYPSKTELEVLSADPNTKSIGFVVREYMGTPVFLYPGENFTEKDLVPITTHDGLKEGDEILIPGLMGGYYKMTVKGTGKGLTAYGERSTGFLEFGKDDRNAWVCGGLINNRGISKLEVTK